MKPGRRFALGAACVGTTILFALLLVCSVNEPAPEPGPALVQDSEPGASSEGELATQPSSSGSFTGPESPSPADDPVLDAWRAGGDPQPVSPAVLTRVAPRRTVPAPVAEAGPGAARIESIEIEWDMGAPRSRMEGNEGNVRRREGSGGDAR